MKIMKLITAITSLPFYLFIFLPLSVTVNAQDEPEYRAEIGVGTGFVGYLGDYNSRLTSGMQPMAEVLGRYRFNPRSALRFSVMYGNIKGNVSNVDTWYPEEGFNGVPNFNKTLVDTGLGYEYNFWPYGTGQEYRGAKPFTPYLMVGLGVSVSSGNGNSAVGMNVPLGVGVKYKFSTRVNLGIEWAIHFSTNDELDGVKDPYGIKSSGMFKNTDCYHALKVRLTYDIAPKCKTCNKDD